MIRRTAGPAMGLAKRLGRTTLNLILLLGNASMGLGAQVQITESQTPLSIQLRSLVRLGDQEGPGAIGTLVALGLRGNGEWVLTESENPEFLKFFSPEGKWLRTIGRSGDGPGEFRSAWFLQVLPGDSLAVFDYGSNRLTVFTPELTVARVANVRIPVSRMALLPDARVVVAASVLAGESVGLPLHLLDAEGRLERSFGADPPIRNASDAQETWRSIARTPRSTIWAAHLNRYLIEEWSAEGERLRHLERSVPWFKPGGTFGRSRDDQKAPGPGIADIHEDSKGLLWVAISVPDANWESALVPGEDPYGRPTQRLKVGDSNKYWDTRLEVLDPRTGELVASVLLDSQVRGFTDTGELITYLNRDGSIPTVEVFEARLVDPNGGGI